jgi:hypothetical protein
LPLPVVGIVVALAAGAIGAAITVRQLKRPAKVILLGEGMSGKTTLLNTWQGKWDAPVHRTQPAGEFVGKFRLNTGKKILTFDKHMTFRNVMDYSGLDEALDVSRDKVKAAQYILYLVKATHLATDPDGFDETMAYERLVADVTRIQRYRDRAKRIIFVVTFADQDQRFYDLDPPTYLFRVRNQLSGLLGMFDADDRPGVVAGSMATQESAETLAGEVIKVMV